MTKTELENLPVLGTAVDLITAIACKVIGTGVAGEVGGEKMSPNAVRVLATATLKNVLNEKTGHA